MLRENQKLIIEYLYLNNHKTEQSAAPISVIHPPLKITADDFNNALRLLLTKQPIQVNQTKGNSLYLTPDGIISYEDSITIAPIVNENKPNESIQLSTAPIPNKNPPKWITKTFYKEELAKYLFKRYLDIIVVGIAVISLIIFGLIETCKGIKSAKQTPKQLIKNRS